MALAKLVAVTVGGSGHRWDEYHEDIVYTEAALNHEAAVASSCFDVYLLSRRRRE